MNNLFMPGKEDQKDLDDLIVPKPKLKLAPEGMVYAVGNEIFAWRGDNTLSYVDKVGEKWVHALAFKPEDSKGCASLYWGSKEGFGIVGGNSLSSKPVFSLECFDGGLWYAGEGCSIRDFDKSFHLGYEENSIHGLCGYNGALYAGAKRIVKRVYRLGGRDFIQDSRVFEGSLITDMCVHDGYLMVARNSISNYNFFRQGIISHVHSEEDISLPPYIRGLTSCNGKLFAGCEDGMWDVFEERRILETPEISALTTVPSGFLEDLLK